MQDIPVPIIGSTVSTTDDNAVQAIGSSGTPGAVIIINPENSAAGQYSEGSGGPWRDFPAGPCAQVIQSCGSVSGIYVRRKAGGSNVSSARVIACAHSM